MTSRTIAIVFAFALSVSSAVGQYRTVIDKEVGSLYQKPNGFSYSAYGAFVGSPPSPLDPDAIRVIMARFDKFSPNDGTMTKGFPYSSLRTFEAQEKAAGRAPIFITATYAGKKRPVLFSWPLKLVNNVPTAPSSMWEYAINVQDPRYIKFWINRFIRPILWQPAYSTPNVWFQLDQSAFNLGLLGVLDDTNHFIPNVPWDPPFPQDANAYFASIASFFSQLNQIAPDIKTMPNIGTMSDPSKFKTVFANIPGAIHEDIYSWHANLSAYTRNNWYTQNFTYIPWLTSQGKVTIFRAIIPANSFSALVTAFSTYSLIKGPNSFFAPGVSGSLNVNPAQWTPMAALLGSPVSTLQSSQQAGQPAGYRLYWRKFNGGTVYLNWTGTTKTITLDPRYRHYDPQKRLITTLVIPDGSGTFETVLTESQPVMPPRVVPRTGSSVASSTKVTLVGDTPNSVLRYTLDGSLPGLSSPRYTTPLQLSGNTLLTTRAYLGTNPSWFSSASFMVSSSSTPSVQFTASSASSPAGAYYPVLKLSMVPSGTVSVNYFVQYANGSTTTGKATFLRGQTYRYVPITVSGSSSTLTTISITSATGAVVGTTHTQSHRIE